MKLEGLPKGYRAVRWGVPGPDDYICHNICPFRPHGMIDYACLIIEPCSDEELDDGIKPFENSEDYIEAARGLMMVLNITTGHLETVLYVGDDGIETVRGAVSYEDLMINYEFSDGRACGYED